MVQPNELRINNWIIVNDGEKPPYNYQLTGFDIYKIDEGGSGIEPIPLTPELLEKCHWVRTITGIYVRKADRFKFRIEFAHGDVWLYVEQHDRDSSIEVELQYLHECQNLYFALTGKELEIKL
jgi:hypothetical protein